MEFTSYDIAIIPIVVALVEVISRLGVPSKFLPLCAIVIGIAAGVFFIAPESMPQAILSGIVVGLSAVGMYSGVKNTVQDK